ncbi:Uncharacterised protein [Mycobacteroides abscessus subsp. abscessus]|nr:Uncharacterised protein [Mycobacteroides abscessus subsp. abscessus]
MTTFSESEVPGTRRTLLPVAMITLAKVSVSLEPSAFLTAKVLASVNVPTPSYSVILFFFIKKCTPATRPSATLRLRSNAAPKSKVASPLIPKVLASLVKM